VQKTIIDILTYIIFIIFICFLPGRALLYFKKIKISILETFLVSTIIGLLLFGLLNTFFSALQLKLVSYFIIVLVDIIFIYQRLKHPAEISNFLHPKWTLANKIFLIVLLLENLNLIRLLGSTQFKSVILLSFFLGLSVFTLSRRLFKNEKKAVIATILIYLIMNLILTYE